MIPRRCLVVLWAAVAAPWLFAQSEDEPPASHFSLHLEPSVEFPFGASAPLFNLGAGLGLVGRYRLPAKPSLFLTGAAYYSLSPLEMDAVLNRLSVGGGLGLRLPLASRLFLGAFTIGGYSYDFMGLQTGTEGAGSVFVNAGAGAEIQVGPRLGVELGVAYRNHFGLYNALAAYGGTRYSFPVRTKRKAIPAGPRELDLLGAGHVLEVSQVQFENVFPVFRKYYDDHPIGTATLKNPYSRPATDIRVTLFLRQYMDAPKVCTAPRLLEAGQSQKVELNALFTEKVLDITEATKAAAEISVEYLYEGRRYKEDISETVRIFDRNAMTWDDDRKAAAFVTAKDPMVLTFSKNVAGFVKEKGSRAVDPNLLLVIALQKALNLYGMSYIVDPRTPYVEFSKSSSAIDFLQFPRQTLEYKAGDCDDLAILYSALLGALGVETAFVTVPGHILIAAALQLSPEEAARSFLNPDELLYAAGKVWLPVEVTELKRGFLEAWQAGVQEWKDHSPNSEAGFYPVLEAWELFEPVGLPPATRDVTLPAEDRVVSGYLQEVMRFIDREIMPRVQELQAEIGRTGSSRAMNKLGVLYARYGMYDKAEEQFQNALQKEELVHCLINLGNLAYLHGDMDKATVYYDRAYRREPGNPTVLVCLVRVNREAGRHEAAQKTYRELEKADPRLAEQFAHLLPTGADSGRAAETGAVKERVLWQDD